MFALLRKNIQNNKLFIFYSVFIPTRQPLFFALLDDDDCANSDKSIWQVLENTLETL